MTIDHSKKTFCKKNILLYTTAVALSNFTSIPIIEKEMPDNSFYVSDNTLLHTTAVNLSKFTSISNMEKEVSGLSYFSGNTFKNLAFFLFKFFLY